VTLPEATKAFSASSFRQFGSVKGRLKELELEL